MGGLLESWGFLLHKLLYTSVSLPVPHAHSHLGNLVLQCPNTLQQCTKPNAECKINHLKIQHYEYLRMAPTAAPLKVRALDSCLAKIVAVVA